MATVKLTLSAEKPLIEDAKRLARERHTSVSAMFSRFLAALSANPARQPPALGPITLKASGIVRLPQGRTDREITEDALLDPHGGPQ
jgi:hypothetical protein